MAPTYCGKSMATWRGLQKDASIQHVQCNHCRVSQGSEQTWVRSCFSFGFGFTKPKHLTDRHTQVGPMLYPRPLTRDEMTECLQLLYCEPWHSLFLHSPYHDYTTPKCIRRSHKLGTPILPRITPRLDGSRAHRHVYSWTKTPRIKSCSGMELDTQLIWFIVWIWSNWIAFVKVSSGNEVPWQDLLGNAGFILIKMYIMRQGGTQGSPPNFAMAPCSLHWSKTDRHIYWVHDSVLTGPLPDCQTPERGISKKCQVMPL